MHAFEFRVRDDGGDWSDWVETDNGDPVYTGGSDQVQIRSRNAPIEGELHYVNVKGDTTFAGSLLNGLRSTVNSAVISLDAGPELPPRIRRSRTSSPGASGEPSRSPAVASRGRGRRWAGSRPG